MNETCGHDIETHPLAPSGPVLPSSERLSGRTHPIPATATWDVGTSAERRSPGSPSEIVSCGYRVAQESEDLLDHGGSPERIVPRNLADETPERRIHLRSSRSSALSGLPIPVEIKALPIPTCNRLRLDDGKSGFPSGPEPGHPDPEDSVPLGKLEARLLPGQRSDLLSQAEILGGHVFLALQECPEYIENDGQKRHERLLQRVG